MTSLLEQRMGDLFEQYVKKFKEPVPLFFMRHLDDKGMCDLIEECLKSGKEYSPELDINSDY